MSKIKRWMKIRENLWVNWILEVEIIKTKNSYQVHTPDGVFTESKTKKIAYEDAIGYMKETPHIYARS